MSLSKYKTPLIIGAVAATLVIIPVTLVGFLPLIRKPTPRPSKSPKALPKGVERIASPGGLELLVSKPSLGSLYHGHKKAPLLLIHGGYGSALCWIRWLPYLASQSRDVYALSLSGHGLSPRPNNFVTADVADFARDIETTLAHIHSLHPENPLPILIGHSAGGGVSQYTIEKTSAQVSGAIFIASFPSFGGWRVYVNWAFHDPWLGARMIAQGGDPKAALSSPALVKSAFFGPDIDKEHLEEFYEGMNPEESVGWPLSMMFTFVDPNKVKEKVHGRVLWIGGENDVLMSPNIMKEAAEKYQSNLRIIPRSGHHLLRDAHWKAGADEVLAQLHEWDL